jgi:AcrR family transcriptional regulator
MSRSASATKVSILRATYRLLYREGFARVSMDAIAAETGVTKRTLYYHFDSKDALVAAVLDHQHVHALARIQKWGSGSARSPREFLAELFRELEAWASEPDWLGSGFTRLTMELSDMPGHPARHAAHQHKLAIENWLAGELKRLGASRSKQLAGQVALLLEGCVSLMLIHRDTSYAATAAKAAIRLALKSTV